MTSVWISRLGPIITSTYHGLHLPPHGRGKFPNLVLDRVHNSVAGDNPGGKVIQGGVVLKMVDDTFLDLGVRVDQGREDDAGDTGSEIGLDNWTC